MNDAKVSEPVVWRQRAEVVVDVGPLGIGGLTARVPGKVEVVRGTEGRGGEPAVAEYDEDEPGDPRSGEF